MTFNGTATLDLNGYTLTGNGNGSVITVNANFTLNDSKGTGVITGGNNVDYYTGGGMTIKAGTTTMNGGTISGNSGGRAGGIYAYSSALLNLYGGTITNNSGQRAGGIYAINLNMYGGTISNNRASVNDHSGAAGGILVGDKSNANIYGGVITGNYADAPLYAAGGLYYMYGNLKIVGGTFTGNDSNSRDYTDATSLDNVNLAFNKSFTIEGGTFDGRLWHYVNITLNINGGYYKNLDIRGRGSYSINGGYFADGNTGNNTVSGRGVASGRVVVNLTGTSFDPEYNSQYPYAVYESKSITLTPKSTSQSINYKGVSLNYTDIFNSISDVSSEDIAYRTDNFRMLLPNTYSFSQGATDKLVYFKDYGSYKEYGVPSISTAFSVTIKANSTLPGVNLTADVVNNKNLGVLSNAKYTLTSHVTLTDYNLTASGTVILDLNGYTLTGNGSGPVITVSSGGNFTLMDSRTGGKVTGGNAQYGAGIYAVGNTTVTINGGTITGNTGTATTGAQVSSDNLLTINGGAIANSGSTPYAVTFNFASSKLTIAGGTVTGNIRGVSANPTLAISNGTVNGSISGVGTTTISGGKVTGTITGTSSATLGISGGTVANASGFGTTTVTNGTVTGKLTAGTTATFTISGGTIGNASGYGNTTITAGNVTGTLTAGVSNATLNIKGGTIGSASGYGTTVITNGTVTGTVTGTSSATLNINGGTIANTASYGTTTVTNGIVTGTLKGASGATLTIKGGTVANTSGYGNTTITAGNVTGTLTGTSSATLNIEGGNIANVSGYGKITIDGGTISGNVGGASNSTLVVNSGYIGTISGFTNVTINHGYFKNGDYNNNTISGYSVADGRVVAYLRNIDFDSDYNSQYPYAVYMSAGANIELTPYKSVMTFEYTGAPLTVTDLFVSIGELDAKYFVVSNSANTLFSPKAYSYNKGDVNKFVWYREIDGVKYCATTVITESFTVTITADGDTEVSQILTEQYLAENNYILGDGLYTLNSDVTLSKPIYVVGNVTIDLKGHKLSGNGEFNLMTVSHSIVLTIKDSVGTGVIIGDSYGTGTGSIINATNANSAVIVNGGTFVDNAGGIDKGAIGSNGVVYVNGGTINGKLVGYDNAVLTINNGYFANNASILSFAKTFINGGYFATANINGNTVANNVAIASGRLIYKLTTTSSAMDSAYNAQYPYAVYTAGGTDGMTVDVNVDSSVYDGQAPDYKDFEFIVKHNGLEQTTVDFVFSYKVGNEYVEGLPTNAGTYTIKVTAYYLLKGDINYLYNVDKEYEYTITPKSIEVVWNNTELIANGLAIAPNATVDTGVAGDFVTLTVKGASSEAGEHTATAVMSVANNNYVLQNTTTSYNIKPNRLATSDNNANVSSDAGFENSWKLSVEQKNNNTAGRLPSGQKALAVYDVKLLDGSNAEVQPNDKVTVSIKLTAEQLQSHNLLVYYMDDNGQMQYIESRRSGDSIVFETDHFSTYTITTTVQSALGIVIYYCVMSALLVAGTAVIVVFVVQERKRNNQ